MAGKGIALAFILILAVAALYYFNPPFPAFSSFPNPLKLFNKTYNPTSPASLAFEVVEAPKTVKAGGEAEVVLTIQNNGRSTAEDVEVLVEGENFKFKASPFNLEPGGEKQVKGRLLAPDVREGTYTVDFRLKYQCGGKHYYSPRIEKQVYVLPAVAVKDVGWKTDLFNPFGKSTIKRGDSTTLHFRVKSFSENVIYEGIKARILMRLKPEGLSFSPEEVEVERLGPMGLSEEYVVTVAADADAPPGQYPLQIRLYTSDGVPIPGAEASLKLTVSS